jgi:outer membrane protein assembly factor BamB
MPSESQLYLVWSFPLELLSEGEQPIVASYFQNGQQQILAGYRKLYAFNLVGQPQWNFELKGNVMDIFTCPADDQTDKVVLSSGKTSDILLSSANLLTYIDHEAYIYSLDEVQTPKIELTFSDEEISALEVCKLPQDDAPWICVATSRKGHWSKGKSKLQVYVLKRRVLWERSFPTVITKLKYLIDRGNDLCLFAGTARGDLISFDSLGDIKWDRPALKGEIAYLSIAHSSKNLFQIVVAGKTGNISSLSTNGDLCWSDQGLSAPCGISCIDVDEDGEDEILIAFTDRLSCYHQSGDILWSTRFTNRIQAFNLSFSQAKEILVCSGQNALILNSRDGSHLHKLELQGKVRACCGWKSGIQTGWAVCIEEKVKPNKFGLSACNQLILGLIAS